MRFLSGAFVLVVGLLVAVVPPARSALHIVDDDGTANITAAGNPDCSAGTAPSTISDGLANTTSSDTVFVCPGRYVENARVDTPGIHLQSTGDSSNTVVFAADPTRETLFVTGDDVRVEGFRFRNGFNGLVYATATGGVAARNRADSNVRDGFLVILGARGQRLVDNQADSNGRAGLSVTNADSVTLQDNLADTNVAGIVLEDANDNLVRNNSTPRNVASGVRVRNGSQGNRIVNNRAVGNLLGFAMNNDADSNMVENNTANGNGVAGVVVNGSTSSSQNNRIENNLVRSNGFGVVLEIQADANRVIGNQVDSNGTGVRLDRVDDNAVLNNTVNANLAAGVTLRGSSTGNAVSSNTVESNRFLGLLVRGSDDNTLSGNSLDNHDTAHVFLRGSSQNTVRGNTIRNSIQSAHGIVLASGSNSNTVNRNSVLRSDTGLVLDASNGNTAEENDFDTNVIGVAFRNADNNRLEANRIRGNDTGIRVTGTFADSEPSNVIRFSTISGNGPGVANHTVRILDARRNFWGAASGPSGGNTDPFTGALATGAGDTIVAPGTAPDTNVAFDPFFTSATLAGGGASGSTGQCLVERAGLSGVPRRTLRNLRDRWLKSPVGRWMTDVYYRMSSVVVPQSKTPSNGDAVD